MPNSKQDIRIVQLAKWQIPKTKSVLRYDGESTYLSIGYFDMIDASPVGQGQRIHPLLAAYGASQRHLDQRFLGKASETGVSLLGDYTVQELFLFTNIGVNGFSETEITEFWEHSSPMMFISLIHIDNESRVSAIISKIKTCFAGKNYLYYFSFDYSGIILLAKDMELASYLKSMFRLNYENKDGQKLIRDSYSFYGFHKKELKKIFQALDDGISLEQAFCESQFRDSTEQFTASVNIGVQNFKIYQEFLKKVKDVNSNIEEYGLFGRHDISLVNKDANLKWLVYVQYLLDRFTQKNRDGSVEKEVSSENLFSTHETFVKVSDIGNYEDIDPKAVQSDEAYKLAKERLDALCNEYLQKMKKNKERYNGEYGIPIAAVKDSILSILKNRFAEDFVLCMYQSFCEFVEYLKEKMEYADDDVEKFNECFNDYFRGLNSLVNSAMHSERQFIQATAFNAIIYDVPSKIMAFYVALIDMLQKLMLTENDKKYTFLLTPSFSNEISVRIISYSGEKPPHDRLLMVSINERSLYNPKAVIRRMAHEVAHFVGDDLRRRGPRKKYIKHSVIYIILSQILHGSFLSIPDLFDLINKIEQALAENIKFADDRNNYSEELLAVFPDIADEFRNNRKITELLYDYIRKVMRSYLEGDAANDPDYQEDREALWKYILELTKQRGGIPKGILEESYVRKNFGGTQLEILAKLIFCDLDQELALINKDQELLLQAGWVHQSVIARVGSRILDGRTMGQYVKGLSDAYSEAFADIQMVLMTGLTYEAYLEGFVNEENIDVERWDDQFEDSVRISMVTFALRITGVWEQPDIEELFLQNSPEARQKLFGLQKKIEKQIALVKNSILDEEKKKIEKYYAVANTFVSADNHVPGDKEELWLENGYWLDNNVMYYINEQLLLYLVECIAKSVDWYRHKERIWRLRKTIKTVSDFEDIENVFTTICSEIKDYKINIFKLPTHDHKMQEER